MDQKQLDILNLMARLDREAPFLNEGGETPSNSEFDSIEEAAAAFNSTLAMRDSIRAQASAAKVPEAWIERIQTFSDTTKSYPAASLMSRFSGWLSSFRESVAVNPQYWGGGLVTACALVMLVSPLGEEGSGAGLGGGIQNPVLPGGVIGTPKISASLSNEVKKEQASMTELPEPTANTPGKGLSDKIYEPHESEDCPPDLIDVANELLEQDPNKQPCPNQHAEEPQ